MSQDFRLWHAPKLSRRRPAQARLEQRAPKPTRAATERIAAMQRELQATFGISGTLDDATGLLDISLPIGDADPLPGLLLLTRSAGFVVYDPQTDLFHYPSGGNSLAEVAPDGVHEGVLICIREFQGPLGSEAEQRGRLDALDQFIHADSPDLAAAIRLALPFLDELGQSDLPLANLYRHTAAELREELPDDED